MFIILRYGRLTLLIHVLSSRPGKGAHMSEKICIKLLALRRRE